MKKQINLLQETLENAQKRSLLTRREEIKRIIEALLFSSNEPLSLIKLRDIIQTSYPVQTKELIELIDTLNQEYHKEKRTFQIDEIAGGYLLRTVEEMHPYVELLHQDRRGEKLSKAAMEVLAIVAYRAPITRPEIDRLRGVESSGTVASLSERGLIEAAGRKEAPGRPLQYATTKKFLQHFGLNDLQDLNQLAL